VNIMGCACPVITEFGTHGSFHVARHICLSWNCGPFGLAAQGQVACESCLTQHKAPSSVLGPRQGSPFFGQLMDGCCHMEAVGMIVVKVDDVPKD